MYLYSKDYNAFDKDERWGSKSKHPPMFIKPHQFKPVLHWENYCFMLQTSANERARF